MFSLLFPIKGVFFIPGRFLDRVNVILVLKRFLINLTETGGIDSFQQMFVIEHMLPVSGNVPVEIESGLVHIETILENLVECAETGTVSPKFRGPAK